MNSIELFVRSSVSSINLSPSNEPVFCSVLTTHSDLVLSIPVPVSSQMAEIVISSFPMISSCPGITDMISGASLSYITNRCSLSPSFPTLSTAVAYISFNPGVRLIVSVTCVP